MNVVLNALIDHTRRLRSAIQGAITFSLVCPCVLAIVLLATSSIGSAQDTPTVRFGAVDIGHHVVLHYAEEGAGVPVVFVHGSLSDMGYWKDQVGAFAKHYRATA